MNSVSHELREFGRTMKAIESCRRSVQKAVNAHSSMITPVVGYATHVAQTSYLEFATSIARAGKREKYQPMIDLMLERALTVDQEAFSGRQVA